jgi:hypothetical protein
MSGTTGPILATGVLAIVNRTVFNGQAMDWRIPPATGLAAIGFSLVERVWPKGITLIAWTTFLTVLLTRTDSSIPSPVESAVSWWNKGG